MLVYCVPGNGVKDGCRCRDVTFCLKMSRQQPALCFLFTLAKHEPSVNGHYDEYLHRCVCIKGDYI